MLKTKIQQLDLVKIEVYHQDILFFQYPIELYSNVQEPKLSSRYYSEYELDEKSKEVMEMYSSKQIPKNTMLRLIEALATGKEFLETEFADVVEFTEEL